MTTQKKHKGTTEKQERKQSYGNFEHVMGNPKKSWTICKRYGKSENKSWTIRTSHWNINNNHNNPPPPPIKPKPWKPPSTPSVLVFWGSCSVKARKIAKVATGQNPKSRNIKTWV